GPRSCRTFPAAGRVCAPPRRARRARSGRRRKTRGQARAALGKASDTGNRGCLTPTAARVNGGLPCQGAACCLGVGATVLSKDLPMSLSVHDALIRLMIVAASADHDITEVELDRIEGLIGRLPVFEGFDRSRLAEVANACADAMNEGAELDGVIAEAIAALPPKLEDTAYALAVEVTAVDLLLEQEELRFLEM